MNHEKIFELDPESGSVNIEMLQFMHPAVVMMVAWTNMWCHSNGIKPKWTSWMRTPEQNKALGATDVHIRRAADISIKPELGWSSASMRNFELEFRRAFRKTGAFTKKNNRLYRQPLVRHDIGHGDHFHMQVNNYASIDDIMEAWSRPDIK